MVVLVISEDKPKVKPEKLVDLKISNVPESYVDGLLKAISDYAKSK